MPDDSRTLIDRCLQGEAAAWRLFVERYTRLVWSIVRRHRLGEADAEDVHQAVFTIAVTRLERLRDAEQVAAWLATTTRRECWRVMRRRRPTATVGDDAVATLPDDEATPEEDRVSIEERQIVREGLEELGGRCRELLEALFSAPGEPSYPQISARLGMPLGSIGPTRARCLRRLSEILERRGIHDEDSGSRS